MERSARYGPRERLLHVGEGRLSDAECLALLLRCGRAGEEAEVMARRILSHFGGVASLARAEVREVSALEGVGLVRAAAIVAAFGMARRLAESRCPPGTVIRSGQDVARLVLETARPTRR